MRNESGARTAAICALVAASTTLIISVLIMMNTMYQRAEQRYEEEYASSHTPSSTSTPKPTSTPAPTPTPTPTPKLTPAPAPEHVKNPGYDRVHIDPTYGLKITYPNTFEQLAWHEAAGESALTYYTSKEDIFERFKALPMVSSDDAEVVFAACNSTGSAIMWISVEEKPNSESIKNAYKRYMKKADVDEAKVGNDGTCGEDYFFFSARKNSKIGMGNTYYCYCKSRDGRYNTLNLLFPEDKEKDVYMPGNTDGYHWELYKSFYDDNFK